MKGGLVVVAADVVVEGEEAVQKPPWSGEEIRRRRLASWFMPVVHGLDIVFCTSSVSNGLRGGPARLWRHYTTPKERYCTNSISGNYRR